MTQLGANRYGKQSVRLVKVVRGPVHRVRDLTVDLSLEGAFDAAYTDGDNAPVVATDTMKNSVYALATEHLVGAIEPFAAALARHHVGAPSVERATVSIREHAWEPLPTPAGPAPDAFRRTGGWTRTATAVADAGGVVVDSGVEDLVVMKTTKSAFSGFPRDAYTTLPEVRDRILATKVSATWRHLDQPADWDARQATLVDTLLATFAGHFSESVQQTIWLLANAMLEAEPGIDDVSMRLPNLHHWIVDLSPFGQPSGDVFVATDQPYGLIEATIHRT